MWIQVYPIEKRTLVPKIVKKDAFSYETIASISFIPTRRMCLWCPIIKRKEIIMWIRACPNQGTNINCKSGRKRCFSSKSKAWISFIPMRRMCVWWLITKWKEISIWISVYPNQWTNVNSKNGRKKSFSYESKASIHLSHWEQWIYGAQSLNNKRLLCDYGFIH